MQQALGLTSNRVNRWRLINKEYGPEIIYKKGEENTVEDAISRLDFTPKSETNNSDQKNWMMLTKRWCVFSTHAIQGNSKNSTMDLNHVFAIRSDEREIVSLNSQ